MDLKSVLNEVDSWPIEDRIRLVQEVWDRLAGQGPQLELSETMKAEIDRRLAAHAAHAADPTAAIPWEQVEAEALARLRR
jgi:putative addiction module component (TIGR02574 family)